MHHAHATASELLQDAIVGNRLTRQARILLGRLTSRNCLTRLANNLLRRGLEAVFCFSVSGKQQFHFTPQVLVPGTGFIQESRPSTLLHSHSRVEQLLDAGPAFRLHWDLVLRAGAIAKPSPASSHASLSRQTLAEPQRFRPRPARQRISVRLPGSCGYRSKPIL